MGASADIYVYNGSSLNYTIMVNNGPQVTVDGTSQSAKWAPVAATNPFTLDLTGSSSPGKFNLGTNQIAVQPEGTKDIIPFGIDIPDEGGVVWQGGALYIYFASYESVSWVLTRNGYIIAGNVTIPS